MPCRVDEFVTHPTDYQRIAQLETLLCSACKVLDYAKMMHLVDESCKDELEKFWQKHQEEDRLRLQAELKRRNIDKLKAQALAKLTPDEIAALKHDHSIPF